MSVLFFVFLFVFFLMIRRPPRSTLFPYTTSSDLHPMSLKWLVTRGDDSGSVWQTSAPSIAEQWTNFILLMGGKANAKKQDTADKKGRWRISFAQIFSNEEYVRGISGAPRVVSRQIWDERDEVVLIDPDGGIDLRKYLLVTARFGRLKNLWGLWDKDEHPIAKPVTDVLQDVDVEDRMLPPLTEEARRASAKAADRKTHV